MLAHVHDRLAHRAVRDLLHHVGVAFGRHRDGGAQSGLLARLLRQVVQRAGQALLLQARGPQLEHQPPGAVGGGGERAPGRVDGVRDAVVLGRSDRLAEPVERDEARRQHLHRVVVQLGGEPAALLLLRAQQALDRMPPLALAPARRLLEQAAALEQVVDLTFAGRVQGR